MMGTLKVFLASVIMLVLAASSAPADDSLALPTDVVKTVAPGVSTVSFEGVTYRIMTVGRYEFQFEKLDPTHHKLTIIPLEYYLVPVYDVCIQWSYFPPVYIDLGMEGAATYILGTETGYAEK